MLSLGIHGEAARPGVAERRGAYVGYSRTDLGRGRRGRVEARQGALTGVYLQFPCRATVTLRPELTFALKGGRTETEDGSVIDVELAYLEIPVLAKVAAPIGRFRPVFFAGPAPALRIGCDFLLFLPEPRASRSWSSG